ncbi:MAG TPA: glucose-6-phosphate isomerase [Pseudorhodoferax sp.]|nr:glucose-6-phosphate isomerase [Pseudorhodoferax sp.]
MDWAGRPRCDELPAWGRLRALSQAMAGGYDVRAALAQDPARVQRFGQQAPELYADLSKNWIDADTEDALFELAGQAGVPAHRDAMFAGEPINNTEQRAVLHSLLRTPAGTPQATPGLDAALAEVHATLDAMLAYAEQVRADDAITDVVNIGIGGSDLGPQMVVRALDAYGAPGRRMHFVSNVDGHELDGVLRGLKPGNSLFLIASKTFTTAETMANARSALAWFQRSGGQDVARHFVALSSNVEAARQFGIHHVFGFWDWVGGRYSLWSAIGLPIAIAVGAARFRELLAGAHAMDRHFREAPPQANLPMRLGLLDVWYRNFLGFTSRSIAPYSSALARLPAYLQQLEMESNGKRVDRHGRPLPFGTSPVLWGEPGTNGQHAYFQMLHQGTDVVPVEFIAVREAGHSLPGHQSALLANVLAQAQALLQGRPDAGGHRDFPGNRPSSFLLLQALTPRSLGALIALQEHRVFTSGSVWGINSFDQWGVELGKVLARDIEPRLASGDADGLDASTASLLQRLRT